MKRFDGLTIVQCGYMHTDEQTIGVDEREQGVREALRYQNPRETGLFCQSGVYEKMGLPVEIREVDGGRCSGRGLGPYEAVTRDFSDQVFEAAARGQAVVTTGGFCNYAPAVAGGLRRALGEHKRIGLVWLDAHADNRILGQNDRPLRYVSIPLSTICGQTMADFRQRVCGLNQPLDGGDVVAGDLRMLDDISRHNLQAAGAVHLDQTAFRDRDQWKAALTALAGRCDAIYLSIDADILQPRYIPGYIKTVPGGQTLEDVRAVAAAVAGTGKLAVCSMFCFNFDKGGDAAAQTFASQQAILESVLENWI
ncbi:MAG: arginase family protein [Clostridia bacterium]|nr:arginase family protein [Clostridia bacterium]